MRMHNKQIHGKKIFDQYKGEDFLKELSGGTVPACKACFWKTITMSLPHIVIWNLFLKSWKLNAIIAYSVIAFINYLLQSRIEINHHLSFIMS